MHTTARTEIDQMSVWQIGRQPRLSRVGKRLSCCFSSLLPPAPSPPPLRCVHCTAWLRRGHDSAVALRTVRQRLTGGGLEPLDGALICWSVRPVWVRVVEAAAVSLAHPSVLKFPFVRSFIRSCRQRRCTLFLLDARCLLLMLIPRTITRRLNVCSPPILVFSLNFDNALCNVWRRRRPRPYCACNCIM